MRGCPVGLAKRLESRCRPCLAERWPAICRTPLVVHRTVSNLRAWGVCYISIAVAICSDISMRRRPNSNDQLGAVAGSLRSFVAGVVLAVLVLHTVADAVCHHTHDDDSEVCSICGTFAEEDSDIRQNLASLPVAPRSVYGAIDRDVAATLYRPPHSPRDPPPLS